MQPQPPMQPQPLQPPQQPVQPQPTQQQPYPQAYPPPLPPQQPMYPAQPYPQQPYPQQPYPQPAPMPTPANGPREKPKDPRLFKRLLLIATATSIVSTVAFVLYILAPRGTAAQQSHAHPYFLAGLIGLAISEACQLLGILVLIGHWASHYNQEKRFKEIFVLILALLPYMVIAIFLYTLIVYLRARRKDPTSEKTQEEKEKLKDRTSNMFVDEASSHSTSAATAAQRATLRGSVRRVVGPSTERSFSDAGNWLVSFTMVAIVLATVATLAAVTPVKNLVSHQGLQAPIGGGGGAGGSVGSGGKAGTVKELSLPSSSNIPAGITTGPDGNLWLTSSCAPINQASDCSGSEILRLTPSGKFTEFPLPSTGSPEGIAVGPDGNLWFSLYRVDAASSMARITPSGTITEFPLKVFDEATSIVAGPDGALWFTEREASRIGRITTDGQASSFPLSNFSSTPSGITVGPDGALWFMETSSSSAAVGRITTSGQITEFPITNSQATFANGYGSLEITKGGDGKLWFTYGNTIGSVTTDGQFSSYPLPDSSNQAAAITTGPDGNVWFAACTPFNGANGGCIHNGIGRITSAGQITMYPIPVGSAVPAEITFGPDKNIWFTEPFSNVMGRMIA